MRKLIFANVLLMMGISISFISTAQKSDSTVTIIFAGEKNQGNYKASKKKKDSDAKNIFKLSPTGVFVGQIPLIYERKLTPNISIQAGVGITNQNFIRTLFIKASNLNNKITNDYPWGSSSTTNDQADELYKFDKRKVETGTMFCIQPKFYVNDDALDGGFFSFAYNSYKYKFSHPKASAYNGSSIVFKGVPQQESESVTDFMVYYGIQSISGHFSFEYSTGIGLRKVKGEKYGAAYDYSNNKIVDDFIPYSQTLFNYEMAFRIGYAF